MKYSALLLFLLLFACSEEPQFIIDPQVRTYYDNFVDEAAKRGIFFKERGLVIFVQEGVLAKYGGNAATVIFKDQRSIYIDSAVFARRGILIEMTVFHELGHALLKRNHSNTWTLMNPNVSGVIDWYNCTPGYSCREGLIEELFNPR